MRLFVQAISFQKSMKTRRTKNQQLLIIMHRNLKWLEKVAYMPWWPWLVWGLHRPHLLHHITSGNRSTVPRPPSPPPKLEVGPRPEPANQMLPALWLGALGEVCGGSTFPSGTGKCGDRRVSPDAWRPRGFPELDAPKFSSELRVSYLMAVKKNFFPAQDGAKVGSMAGSWRI